MPTYLSPGVYVEEVDSGSRPIEGVGTAVAAFVGLADDRTVQPADAGDQLDPVHLDVRRLHRRLVPRPFRLRLLPERRRQLLRRPDRRRRSGADRFSRAARPHQWGESPFRISATAPGPAGNDLTVEIVDGSAAKAPAEGETIDPAEQPFKLIVKRGGQAVEEFDNLTAKRGRQNVAHHRSTQQSKLIRIEETDWRRSRHRPGARAAWSAPHWPLRSSELTHRRLRRRRRRPHRVRRPRGRRRDHDGRASPT